MRAPGFRCVFKKRADLFSAVLLDGLVQALKPPAVCEIGCSHISAATNLCRHPPAAGWPQRKAVRDVQIPHHAGGYLDRK